MTPKRKYTDVQEVNVEIKIKKYFENLNITITVDDAVDKAVQVKSDLSFETIEVTSPNSENSKMNGTEKMLLSSLDTVSLIQKALNSTVLVDALESIPALKKKCARLGVNVHFGYQHSYHKKLDPNICGQYEVERILDHDTEKHLYFIKWKGYSIEHSTWEPIDHLDNVSHLTHNFRLMERSLSEDETISYKKLVLLSCLLSDLVSSSNKDPYILLKLNGKPSSEYKPGDLYELKRKVYIKSVSLLRYLNVDEQKYQSNYGRILEKAMKDLLIIVGFGSIEYLENAVKRRKEFFKCLKAHEAKLNCLILLEDDRCGSTIEIENNSDFDLPPDDFVYIIKSKPGVDVIVSQEPSWFCNCYNCFSNTAICCPKMNGSSHIYNNYGHLKKLKQTTIFECNSKCKCPPTCPNRVIQNGQKFKLGIFKTDDDRGWGVKALEQIPKGQFIVEYVGEIITVQEAIRRSANGENPFHKSYLFDLEYEIGTHCDYVVDGAKFGNVSRFVNHSCSPNMEVYMFWIDNPDVRMPRIAFFSQKCIASGEELTFDYRMNAPGMIYASEDNASIIRVPCKCRSSKCRKFLF